MTSMSSEQFTGSDLHAFVNESAPTTGVDVTFKMSVPYLKTAASKL